MRRGYQLTSSTYAQRSENLELPSQYSILLIQGRMI